MISKVIYTINYLSYYEMYTSIHPSKKDSSWCIERPTPFVKAMRYLIHTYAISINDYILIKCPMMFIYLHDRYGAVLMTYATSFIFWKIVVLEEQLYKEQYWYNNKDNIQQINWGYNQWILPQI